VTVSHHTTSGAQGRGTIFVFVILTIFVNHASSTFIHAYGSRRCSRWDIRNTLSCFEGRPARPSPMSSARVEAARAPARSSVAGAGAQSAEPVDVAQQQEGGAGGTTIPNPLRRVAQEALPPVCSTTATQEASSSALIQVAVPQRSPRAAQVAPRAQRAVGKVLHQVLVTRGCPFSTSSARSASCRGPSH
jgi:hypothetical protein